MSYSWIHLKSWKSAPAEMENIKKIKDFLEKNTFQGCHIGRKNTPTF